ncbi:hypothetical protein [Sphingobium boeckii]|uniref:Uncharacterized protein n=1 Tax=Sphingobium boeckii TaxID=1082345 RepID=A0A7W9EDD6_9SPHN|nr:hypothetical protein [Sphingobium boeckii]MBB5685007.1 hypothetical protein [Sphingobium boeckii]
MIFKTCQCIFAWAISAAEWQDLLPDGLTVCESGSSLDDRFCRVFRRQLQEIVPYFAAAASHHII